MKELEIIEQMIYQLKRLKKSIQKRDMLNSTFLNNTTTTPKQREKINTELTWLCMEIDKEKTNIARTYKGSSIEVGVEGCAIPYDSLSDSFKKSIDSIEDNFKLMNKKT